MILQEIRSRALQLPAGPHLSKAAHIVMEERKKERIFIYLPYGDSNLLKCHIQTSNIHMGDLRSKFEYDICVMLRCQSTTAEDNGLDAVVQLPNALEEGLPGIARGYVLVREPGWSRPSLNYDLDFYRWLAREGRGVGGGINICMFTKKTGIRPTNRIGLLQNLPQT